MKNREVKKFSKDEIKEFQLKFAEIKKRENLERGAVVGFIFSRSGFTKEAEDREILTIGGGFTLFRIGGTPVIIGYCWHWSQLIFLHRNLEEYHPEYQYSGSLKVII